MLFGGSLYVIAIGRKGPRIPDHARSEAVGVPIGEPAVASWTCADADIGPLAVAVGRRRRRRRRRRSVHEFDLDQSLPNNEVPPKENLPGRVSGVVLIARVREPNLEERARVGIVKVLRISRKM